MCTYNNESLLCFALPGISCNASELINGFQYGNITDDKEVYDYGETISVDCDYGYQPIPAGMVTCLEADGFQNIHCKGKILRDRKIHPVFS